MTETHPAPRIGLTVYCGRAGDHNDRGMLGAAAVGEALSERLGLDVTTIGTPASALDAGWASELAAAEPTFAALTAHVDRLLGNGLKPLCALSRCAASLATLPVLMRHRPDACVVWLDAHGDLNTPGTTLSGYLGGMALAGPAGLWGSGFGQGLPLSSIILVGARDLDPAEQALVDAGAVRLIPCGANSAVQLADAVAGRPVHVHLDCDVLEPGIVPTDYRVPGGFTLDGLEAVCQTLAKNEILGLEIAEFENTWPNGGDAVSPAALLDALEPLLARLLSG